MNTTSLKPADVEKKWVVIDAKGLVVGRLASVIAMRECQETPVVQSRLYEERRDVVCRGLDKLGWTYEKPRASMFVWAKINPSHFHPDEGTLDFCLRMMDEAEVDFGEFHIDTGLNILGGIRFRRGTFVELKTTVYSDPAPTLLLIFGYNF